MDIALKRIYEDPAPDDGCRVLVDRLWPRGVARERAHLDAWLKDVAPSPELRSWWNHDPERQGEFARRYRAELDESPATVSAVAELRELARAHASGRITLVYGARDPQVNHARVLAEYLGAGAA